MFKEYVMGFLNKFVDNLKSRQREDDDEYFLDDDYYDENEYYDDEELDSLAGISPENYTDEQEEAVRAVFSSLQESDVPGWCRSLQLRNIALPADVREEALMIVRELRSQNHA